MTTLTTLIGSILLALMLGGAGGFFKGIGYEKAAERTRQAAQAAADRAQEQKTARTTFRLQEVRDAENLRINDRLADALQRLRSRPDRLPEPAAAACAGTTGAQLSGPDGGFLAGEAARADRLRADLETCRGWIQTVTGGTQ